MLGILSIGAGFVNSKIVLIVLRALSGLGTLSPFHQQLSLLLNGLRLFAAASLTIPSALSLLVDVFPEKKEQARMCCEISHPFLVFEFMSDSRRHWYLRRLRGRWKWCVRVAISSSALLNVRPISHAVLGLIIGAIFVQYANWSWVFWFVAIVASLIAWFGTIMIPGGFMPTTPSEPGKPRWKALDIGGVSILTGKSANLNGLQLKG